MIILLKEKILKKSYLNNKTILITGASGGLGFAMAKLLIEKFNCKVIGIARNEQKMLNSIAQLNDKKDNFSYKIFDVSNRENWLAFYDYLIENNIGIDILINNAGFMLPFSKFEKYSQNEIDEIINTNFIANIISIKTLLPILKKSSSPAIINICSSAGLCAVVGQSMYSATKSAMRSFTEALSQEYKREIFISGVYPGFIKTDIMNRQKVDTKNNKLINKMMMPLDKASKKIVKKISKKKKRIVLGLDGKLMNFFYKFFPNMTLSAITKVLKSSKMELFDEVFK